MRQGLRDALGAAALLAVLTACSPGSATPAPPAPASSSATAATPSASVTKLDEVINRTRTALTTTMAGKAEAPDPRTLMLAQAWPGGAAYVWETPDQRWCSAEIYQVTVQGWSCAAHPLDPPLASPAGVTMLDTFFTDGWVQLIGADHQEVTSAACSDTPLTVRRIGTLADGARTLYAVWFPTYTKGDVTLTTCDRAGATARAALPLGVVGDRACTPVS